MSDNKQSTENKPPSNEQLKDAIRLLLEHLPNKDNVDEEMELLIGALAEVLYEEQHK